MFNNPYYNPQVNIDRINNQIAELERMRTQIQQPTQMQPSINQTFQLANNNQTQMKYVNSVDDVNKELVIVETPFFKKDMSVVWIKNAKGDIRSYELKKIIVKDEKDEIIEDLRAQINELKGRMTHESDVSIDEPIEDEKSSGVPISRTSTKKSK